MSQLKVLNQIRISDIGPINEKGWPIHLQQGSLDGACGIYSLIMALMICDAVKDKDHGALLKADQVRKNSDTGKAISLMQEMISNKESLLFRSGVQLNELENIVKDIYKNSIVPEYRESTVNHGRSAAFKKVGKYSTELVHELIIKEVKSNNPVIVHLASPDGSNGHAVVVVGTEYSSDETKPSRLFLLDPGIPAPTVSAWNSVIDLFTKPRKQTHTYWDEVNGEREIIFFSALALIQKKKNV